MNTKLGLHVGIKEKIPQTEQDKIAYLASIYSWQEWNGPLVLACDEDFYMWLNDFGAEFLSLPDDVIKWYEKQAFVACYKQGKPYDFLEHWDSMAIGDQRKLRVSNLNSILF